MSPYYPFGLNPSQPPLVRGGVRFALPLRFATLFSKWVVIPHFEKGGARGDLRFVFIFLQWHIYHARQIDSTIHRSVPGQVFRSHSMR